MALCQKAVYIRSPFRSGKAVERTSCHHTKRMRGRKKSTVKAESQIRHGYPVGFRLCTVQGQSRSSDRLRIRDIKSLFVIQFFEVVLAVVFSLEPPATFLLPEVGEVHDILRFAFGALGNEVSADIRKHPVNDKLAFGASYFPHRKSSCFSFAQFQLGLYVRRWRRTVISLFSLAVIHFRHHLSSSAESIPAYPFAPEAHIS